MISAIALVLFVRDKYTINTLLELLVSSALIVESFICDDEHAANKRKTANSLCAKKVLLFITLYY